MINKELPLHYVNDYFLTIHYKLAVVMCYAAKTISIKIEGHPMIRINGAISLKLKL